MSFIDNIELLICSIDKRPNWDEYFMSLALLASCRSVCNRLKVGCVIVKDNNVLSTGYNGFISGGPHNSIIRDNHEQATIHAETNAIAFCAKRGTNINGSIIYITHFPCINCFKLLKSSGITTIIYNKDYNNDPIVYTLAEHNTIVIKKMNKIIFY